VGGVGVLEGDVSREEVERVKREIAEQEILIKGYQSENEKLVEQTKALKALLKESERRSFLKVETLQKEIAALKTQLAGPGGPGGIDAKVAGGVIGTAVNPLDATRLAVKAEALESQLATAQRDAADRQAALEGEVAKLKAQLAEAEATIGSFKGRSEEEVEELRATWASERARLERCVVDLEGRLEREMERGEIRDAELERRARSAGVEDVDGKRGRGRIDRMAGKSAEARRIKELEKVVAELEARLGRKKSGSEVGTPSGRGQMVMDEQSYVRHLKEKVKRGEAEREAMELAWEARLKSIHAEAKTLREQYETRLFELHSQLEKAQRTSTVEQAELARQAAAASDARVNELENQLEHLLQSYDARLKAASGGDELDRVRAAEKELRADFKVREEALRARVGELEAVVDSQAATLEQLRGERAAGERELAGRLRERDRLVGSYEERIAELRGEFHDRVFGKEEQGWMEKVQALRIEVEALRGENNSLKNRVEISEATRHAVQESTIAILKQAQDESAQLALAHHERALKMLREETSKHAGAASEAEAGRLRRAMAEAQGQADKWKARCEALEREQVASTKAGDAATSAALSVAERRVGELEALVEELERECVRLQGEIMRAKEGWPVERRRFEELGRALREMEIRFERRESELKGIVEAARAEGREEVEALRAKYASLVRKRDGEIRRFKEEMEWLVKGLEALRQERAVAR
ncbi:hypothetical protein HK101_002336, partial [Irineochytrium annulatum]